MAFHSKNQGHFQEPDIFKTSLAFAGLLFPLKTVPFFKE